MIQKEEGLKQDCDLKDPCLSCCSQLCFSSHQKEASSTSIACSDSRLSGKTLSLKNLTWAQRAQTPEMQLLPGVVTKPHEGLEGLPPKPKNGGEEKDCDKWEISKPKIKRFHFMLILIWLAPRSPASHLLTSLEGNLHTRRKTGKYNSSLKKK